MSFDLTDLLQMGHATILDTDSKPRFVSVVHRMNFSRILEIMLSIRQVQVLQGIYALRERGDEALCMRLSAE